MLAYIKLVYNFTFSDDNHIYAEEYAEIISLIVRIEMAAKDRLENAFDFQFDDQKVLYNKIKEFILSLNEGITIKSKNLVIGFLYNNKIIRS